MNKKKKKMKRFLTAVATVIKKDSTTSLRKHANELKVHKKTLRTEVKEDFSSNLNPIDYALLGVLENKTNATFHPNICSLKTDIEEDWNKMCE